MHKILLSLTIVLTLIARCSNNSSSRNSMPNDLCSSIYFDIAELSKAEIESLSDLIVIGKVVSLFGVIEDNEVYGLIADKWLFLTYQIEVEEIIKGEAEEIVTAKFLSQNNCTPVSFPTENLQIDQAYKLYLKNINEVYYPAAILQSIEISE